MCLFNLVLIPLYGINGAAIATVLSQFIANFFYDLFDNNIKPLIIIKTRALFPGKLFLEVTTNLVIYQYHLYEYIRIFLLCLSKNVSVCIALAHNNNMLRNTYIKPRLDDLRSIFRKDSRLHISRSQFSQISDRMFCQWLFCGMLFINHWTANGVDTDFFDHGCYCFMSICFLVRNVKKTSSGTSWKRNSFVETVVTDSI